MKQRRRTTRFVKSLRNGQITIPAEFRRQLGIEPDTLLELSIGAGTLTITPVHATRRSPGSGWLRDLYEHFAPVREEAAAYSEQEIDAAIDAAVQAVRSKRS